MPLTKSYCSVCQYVADNEMRLAYPDLPIPIDRASAVAVYNKPFTSKEPYGRLILIPNFHRVVKPVTRVVAPQQVSVHVDLDVRKVSRVHDAVDVVRRVGAEDDPTSIAAFFEVG